MNQKAIDYLEVNKEKYTQEILIRQLQNSGYSQPDIMEAVGVVFGAVEAQSETQLTEIKYAGFWIRYVAAVVDTFLLSIFSGIIGFILGLLIAVFGLPEVYSKIGSLLGMIITWTYYIFTTNKYQATLGKMALGLKVITEDGERASLGKIIIREIPGKILSVFTLLIGYIMAGFTAKKQALHDKLAGTVVVYKDPNKKVKAWVIGVVVMACALFMVAIIGILASIVLVSLSSAKNKASDAAVIKTVSSYIPDALIYYESKESFSGFRVQAQNGQGKIVSCTEEPIVKIAADGQQMAIFQKLCSADDLYFCSDVNSDPKKPLNQQEVDGAYVRSGKTTCE